MYPECQKRIGRKSVKKSQIEIKSWKRNLRKKRRNKRKPQKEDMKRLIVICLYLAAHSIAIRPSDITKQAFGSINDTIISAFGDFNSDELTDVFVRSTDGKTLEILLASDTEPLLRQSESVRCHFKRLTITSIVPGDFDGDAYMDLLITSKANDSQIYNDNNLLEVYINWGESNSLNCTDETAEPLFRTIGEPIALDYNRDMIIDLFGLNENGTRTFWIFSDKHDPPEVIQMQAPGFPLPPLAIPHSNAYLDLNNDFKADLFLATTSGYEVWHGTDNQGFIFSHNISKAENNPEFISGQSIFLDIELNGNIAQVLPVCHEKHCRTSQIMIYADGKYNPIDIEFKDDNNQYWQFISPDPKQQRIYQNSITLRGGDFNLDGYPDMLVTLTNSTDNNGLTQTFLMENVGCDNCKPLTRTFKIQWKAFSSVESGSVVGAFYDFYQDGILDIIFVKSQLNGISKPIAFRNTLDYDANFVKVMVLTGLTNKHKPDKKTPLGKKKRTYGTNLPGPRIAYNTTKPDGDHQASTSVQIPQSAYFALHLPYTIFGLGRTPNFLDSLSVGISGRNRTWTQLIPNSQMVVVPWPSDNPNRWKAQLFITPSKLIWMSVLSLSATCVVITIIIIVLHIKERRQDRLEKLLETQPLHFDAM